LLQAAENSLRPSSHHQRQKAECVPPLGSTAGLMPLPSSPHMCVGQGLGSKRAAEGNAGRAEKHLRRFARHSLSMSGVQAHACSDSFLPAIPHRTCRSDHAPRGHDSASQPSREFSTGTKLSPGVDNGKAEVGERLHGSCLPRDPMHPVLDIVAIATRLTLPQVQAEQSAPQRKAEGASRDGARSRFRSLSPPERDLQIPNRMRHATRISYLEVQVQRTLLRQIQPCIHALRPRASNERTGSSPSESDGAHAAAADWIRTPRAADSSECGALNGEYGGNQYCR
jgi:hypothetical protein